jgi:hypothetical protein
MVTHGRRVVLSSVSARDHCNGRAEDADTRRDNLLHCDPGAAQNVFLSRHRLGNIVEGRGVAHRRDRLWRRRCLRPPDHRCSSCRQIGSARCGRCDVDHRVDINVGADALRASATDIPARVDRRRFDAPFFQRARSTTAVGG